MLEQINNSATLDFLQRGMNAAHLRQEVIADNIANVNTPGFKKSNVVFEDMLRREMYGEPDDGKLEMVRTHAKHLPVKELNFRAEPRIEVQKDTIMRTDKNNVDIDVEMAKLAETQIYYQALTNAVGGYFTKVKNVISSKG